MKLFMQMCEIEEELSFETKKDHAIFHFEVLLSTTSVCYEKNLEHEIAVW